MKIPNNPKWLLMLTSTAKITTCIRPLKNWPLYIAPTPGISPSTAATAGFGVPAGGTTNGCCMFCQLTAQGSQSICPDGVLRTQFAQSALPQFWQYADA